MLQVTVYPTAYAFDQVCVKLVVGSESLHTFHLICSFALAELLSELFGPAQTGWVDERDVEWRGNDLHCMVFEPIVELNTMAVALFDSLSLGINGRSVLVH